MVAVTNSVFERGFPGDGEGQRLRDDADFQRAVTAYRFWYPTVSVEGIFNGNREHGLADNESVGIAATGPRQVGFTLNSDTPYGAATLDLSEGPIGIELPAGAYIGLVDDHHQRWVMDMGIPGPDQGRGGKYLVLPPDYDGKPPTDRYLGRCSSVKALLAVRALPVGGDLPKALDALRAIKIYPLSNPDARMEFVDTSADKMDSTCLRWEDNLQYWEVLGQIINAEPIVDEFRPMYGLLSSLGIEKGKPFTPDERMTDILCRAARAGRDQLLVSAFASVRPDRLAWPDRSWEWAGLVPDSADFETPAGLDLEARDRWFAQAIVASPAMFRRLEGSGSLYWLGLRDQSGAYLDGGNSYRLSIPLPVPGKLFWSITVYDSQTRSQIQTDQDKAALRSLFELHDLNDTGSAELQFSPTPPANGDSGSWIQTAPGRGWFAYIRIYGPERPAFDGSWKPGEFERTPERAPSS
jgi:hypothetical protein